jgi:CheY-like chemotaxis protein
MTSGGSPASPETRRLDRRTAVTSKGGLPMRVLVVEDERILADAIAEWLRRETFAVDVVYDGDAALERVGVNDYDVVVLDRDLPVVHGDDVCRAIVESQAQARVLMLTAATAVRDRSPAWPSARTTTWASRSRSWSFRAGARARPASRKAARRCSNGPASGWTRSAGGESGTVIRSPSARKEFAVLAELMRPTARWSPPRICWSGPGTSTSTRSPTWSG